MNVYSVFVFAILAISSVSSIGVIKSGGKKCNNGYGGGNIIIGAEKPQKAIAITPCWQVLAGNYEINLKESAVAPICRAIHRKFAENGLDGLLTCSSEIYWLAGPQLPTNIGVIKGGKGKCRHGYGGGNIIIGADKPQK
uniref:Pept_C1 domain-containing protein n=1 Tax=Caenorhabditis japonica TaxID=281687 RepID=A0A8R1I5C0_CAEJA